MISLENIKNAVSQKLNALFGDSYKIYTEEIKQGLDPPAFFIQFLEPAQKQVLNNRYYRTYPLDIIFFPVENGSEISQCESVAEILFDGMEYITVDDSLCRGTKMHYEIVDKVLHFFVQFNMHVLKSKSSDEYMKNLKYNGFMKG
ncbi:phage tail terminator family protein [Defluviitalea raffinosedens]